MLLGCQQAKEKAIEKIEEQKEMQLQLKESNNEMEINALLNNWHQAATVADADAFFGTMTEDALYLGTDPSEKWQRDELRKWADFAFKRDTAWAFEPYNRDIHFNKGDELAWFDELLKTKMGICRGSGIVVKTHDGWRIKYYNLSVTIANEKMDAFVKL